MRIVNIVESSFSKYKISGSLDTEKRSESERSLLNQKNIEAFWNLPQRDGTFELVVREESQRKIMDEMKFAFQSCYSVEKSL